VVQADEMRNERDEADERREGTWKQQRQLYITAPSYGLDGKYVMILFTHP
jgi:hypothetical protein